MAEGREVVEELCRMLNRRPFLPFAIVMSSGERHEVTGIHQVAIGQNVAVVLRPGELSDYVALRQISKFEVAGSAI